MGEERKIKGESICETVKLRESLAELAPKQEREPLEENILRAKQELELTIDAMQDLVAMIDNQYKFVRVNKALADKFGLSPKELVGSLCYKYVCNREEPCPVCPHDQVMADGQERTVEMYLENLGGYYLVTFTPIRDNGGFVTGLVHVARDITEHKHAEEALQESEDKFRRLIESSSDWFWEVDADFRYTYSSPNVKQILGYEPEEIIGRTPFEFMPEEEAQRVQSEVSITFGEGRPLERLENVNLAKNGQLVTLETSGAPFFDADGTFLGYRGIDRDITRRKHVEKQLEDARVFLQSIIDGVGDSIIVIDSDRQVKLMNRAARQFSLGDRPMTDPCFCYQLCHGSEEPCRGIELNCPHTAIFKTGQPVTVTHTHLNKDGVGAIFEIHASPIFNEKGEVTRVVEVCRDVTNKMILEEERKRLDERLYRQQKEESILTLAGGIAHDFNNLLMAVLGNAELLQMGFQPLEKEYAQTENIVTASKRMADLTKQLLAYAKSGMHQPEIVSLNDAIKRALNLTHKGKAREIEVELDLAEGLWPVFVDPPQMDQVFINLFTNAFEAMERSGGCLTVYAENTVKEKAWECYPFNHEHQEGQYVHIRIADTGPGIAEELRSKIFEPFFTTKFLGRGLGLPAVAGILQKDNGCISVEGDLGKGTIFHLYLPRAKEEEVTRKQRGKPFAEKILVIDDEPQILLLLETMLTKMGYAVVLAANAKEGLDIFRRQRSSIKMAILDIQLPDMNGKKLFAELKSLEPNLKVLISSGYDEGTALEELGPISPEGFIQKPYLRAALEEKVKEIVKG